VYTDEETLFVQQKRKHKAIDLHQQWSHQSTIGPNIWNTKTRERRCLAR